MSLILALTVYVEVQNLRNLSLEPMFFITQIWHFLPGARIGMKSTTLNLLSFSYIEAKRFPHFAYEVIT
jgi:hypothetical protein